MSRKSLLLMPSIALILGALAVALSFRAYAKRIKNNEVGPRVNGECHYPSSSACALGIIASIFLLAEQVVITVATGCFCCCGARFSSTCAIVTSVILFVFSWLAFVVAFMELIHAAILNNVSYLAKAQPYKVDICKVGQHNLFLGATLWCIISIALGLISYALWACGTTSNENDNRQEGYGNYANHHEQGIAMGQPHAQLSKKEQF